MGNIQKKKEPDISLSGEKVKRFYVGMCILVFAVLMISFAVLFIKQPSKDDFSNKMSLFVSVLSGICTILGSAVALLRDGEKRVNFKTLSGILLLAVPFMFTITLLYPYIITESPKFISDIAPILTAEEIENEINELVEKDEEYFENTPDPKSISTITNDILPTALEQNDKVPYASESVYPLKYTNDISVILSNPDSIFEVFETTGILDSNTHETYSYAKPTKLNSPPSAIDGYDMKYDEIVREAEKIYIKVSNEYFDNPNPIIGIDKAISYYGTMIDYLEAARIWSSEYARGVDYDLVALIARDYKEKADLYSKRNEIGDNRAALECYAQAIEEYSQLYRMCKRENAEQKIKDLQVLYWIASVYNSMGDIQRQTDEYYIRLSSFTTADSFFDKQMEFKAYPFFEAYSRYYSAMSSHKIYVLVRAKDPDNLPRELKYYLADAYNNYRFAQDSRVLKQKEIDYARFALKQIASACLDYLEQYPDEIDNDVMKSRGYYQN